MKSIRQKKRTAQNQKHLLRIKPVKQNEKQTNVTMVNTNFVAEFYCSVPVFHGTKNHPTHHREQLEKKTKEQNLVKHKQQK